MGIDHRGLEKFVPQELLNGSNVIALFQQMDGKTVSQRMD